MPRRVDDPFASQNFRLEIAGVQVAGFSECTGLNAETNIIEYREGTDDIFPRKLPGLSKFGNVTLKRGLTTGTELFDWHNLVMQGNITRGNVSIVVLDESRAKQGVLRYNLTNAWPSKYMAPDFKANANEIAIESIEITHEGVVKVLP
jgi:phage tail-like protein